MIQDNCKSNAEMNRNELESNINVSRISLFMYLLIFLFLLHVTGIKAEASGNWYKDYQYHLFTNEKVILLEKYVGTETDLYVPKEAVIDGITYTTAIRNGSYTTGSVWGTSTDNNSEKSFVKSLSFEKGVLLPENCDSLFSGCYSLTSLDLSNLVTTGVTSMNRMFKDCSQLKSLNVSNFNTSSVASMNSMFYGCSSLTDLDLSSFNTSKVTGMSELFSGCTNLCNINLSSFDTSKVVAMNGMFEVCTKLKGLDLKNFNTSNVYYMQEMFLDCSSLKEVDLSSFNTSKVVRMDSMFDSCENLRSLDLSSFNTYRVYDMRFMFNRCCSLEYLDVTSFDTSNVEDMRDFLYYNNNLKEVDLRSFNTDNAMTSGMFYQSFGDDTTLYLPEGFGKDEGPFLFAYRNMLNTKIFWAKKIVYGGSKASWNEIGYGKYLDKNIDVYCSDGMIPKDITLVEFNGVSDAIYSGKDITYTIDATFRGNRLIENVDYIIKYTDNINVGKGTITITGIGNYSGEKFITFTIKAADIAKLSFSDIEVQKYTGLAITPKVIVCNGDIILTEGTDYYLTYTNNINVGVASISIEGKGNYKGAKTINFVIADASKNEEQNKSENTSYKISIIGNNKAELLQYNGAGKIKIDKIELNGKKYTITSIAKGAFKGNKKITSVILGSGIVNIGDEAFSNCTALESVTIGNKVKTIGKKTFNGCKNLKTIVIKGGALKKIGKNAFKGIKKGAVIKVPKSKKKEYKKLFKKAKLPASVKIK